VGIDPSAGHVSPRVARGDLDHAAPAYALRLARIGSCIDIPGTSASLDRSMNGLTESQAGVTCNTVLPISNNSTADGRSTQKIRTGAIPAAQHFVVGRTGVSVAQALSACICG
jgi:hypothetical protein